MHHHFIRAADVKPAPAFPKHAKGYRRFALSDRSVGAVHTGWGMSELDAGKRVVTVDFVAHDRKRSNVVVVPEPCQDPRRFVRFRAYRTELRANGCPPSLSLH